MIKDVSIRFLTILFMLVCLFIIFISVNSASAEGISVYQLQDEKKWSWPVEGKISDYYGTRFGKHKGLDIASETGSAVYVVEDGIVSKSYYSYTYGQVVFVHHFSGSETVYAHLRKRLVSEGDYVSEGQVIGEVGSSGESTGSHLHFEVHLGEWNYQKSSAVDPLKYLNDLHYTHLNLEQAKEDIMSILTSKQIGTTVKQKQGPFHIAGETLEVNKAVSQYENNSKSEFITVVVEKGDSIWKIAQTYHVSESSIFKWNQLKNDIIHPGQKMIIYPNEETVYKVLPGDTLPKIAKLYEMNETNLREINNLAPNEYIYPNQILIVAKE